MACRDQGRENKEGSPKVNKTNSLFPSLLNLLKSSVQADSPFPVVSKEQQLSSSSLLSAFFATVVLKCKLTLFADVASALYFPVVCWENLIH